MVISGDTLNITKWKEFVMMVLADGNNSSYKKRKRDLIMEWTPCSKRLPDIKPAGYYKDDECELYESGDTYP